MGKPQPQKVIKGTVLCLHGFAQNGPTFSAKASGIRKMLKKSGYHTVFINGPLKLTPADLPFEAASLGADDKGEDPNFRGWVHTSVEKFDIKPPFESIKEAYAEHGPFIGILGFSQGAGIVGLILNHINEISGCDKAAENLKFAIMYSSFLFKEKSVQSYYQQKIKLPTLHIFGELDTLVSSERSQALVDLCENATVFKHPGGHYVPNTKDLLKREVAWVESIVNPEGAQAETAPAPAKGQGKAKTAPAPKKPVESEAEKQKREEDELNKLADQVGKLGTA
ncbi:unnamed protein product [Ambrosiozyma monospora]|uniref:Unnamed protein product n=1 Tax=Ambrosiozyma monospora TaxID=43982 RepID=A0A9W7DE12_AMBMO|nr:unnamed protein product [Ambrosiozyma monospora]